MFKPSRYHIHTRSKVILQQRKPLLSFNNENIKKVPGSIYYCATKYNVFLPIIIYFLL